MPLITDPSKPNSEASTSGSSSSSSAHNQPNGVLNEDLVEAMESASLESTAIRVSIPKLDCSVDLSAPNFERQLRYYNNALRNALTAAGLVAEDGSFVVPKFRIMAMWRMNATQELNDAVDELEFANPLDKNDFEKVTSQLITLRKQQGASDYAEFQFAKLSMLPNETMEKYRKRLIDQAAQCDWDPEEREKNMLKQFKFGQASAKMRTLLMQAKKRTFVELYTYACQLESTEKSSEAISDAQVDPRPANPVRWSSCGSNSSASRARSRVC